MQRILIALVSAFFLCSTSFAQNSCSQMGLGIEANLDGFIPFPADNAWNQNIANAPVDPNSVAYIDFIRRECSLAS